MLYDQLSPQMGSLTFKCDPWIAQHIRKGKEGVGSSQLMDDGRPAVTKWEASVMIVVFIIQSDDDGIFSLVCLDN